MFLAAHPNDPPPWAFVVFFAASLVVTLWARHRNADDARRILSNDIAARFLGLFVILFGTGLAYLLAYGPISDAMQGHRTILLRRGSVGLPGLIVFVGLALLLGGKRSPKLLMVEDGQGLSTIQWGFVATCLAICLTLELGLNYYIQMQ